MIILGYELPREATSIKVHLVLLTTVLLLKGFITDTIWASVVSGLMAMREVSDAHTKYLMGPKE